MRRGWSWDGIAATCIVGAFVVVTLTLTALHVYCTLTGACH